MNNLTQFFKIILFPIYRLIFWYSVEGLENIPTDKGIIVCSNHISNLDPIFWIIVLKRRIHYMAKKELFKNKILGWLLPKFDVFPIDRHKLDVKSIKHAINVVKSGDVLGIFPEGTRSRNGEIHEAKSGVAYIARSAKCDVLPVAIKCKGSVTPFKRVKMVIGKPITNEELFRDVQKGDLQVSADRIMNEIKSIWEKI